MSGPYASILARSIIPDMAMANIERIRRLRRMSLVELRFRLAQKLRIGRERIVLTWTRNGSISKHSSWKNPGNGSNIADTMRPSGLTRGDVAAESEHAS